VNAALLTVNWLVANFPLRDRVSTVELNDKPYGTIPKLRVLTPLMLENPKAELGYEKVILFMLAMIEPSGNGLGALVVNVKLPISFTAYPPIATSLMAG
jgi:hypothetical protein